MNTDTNDAAHRDAPRGPYRWAAFCVGFCIFLLLAGANVRTQRAGLTVPDWPLMYGDLVPGWDRMKMLYKVDTLRAEVLHRHIATTMGLFTLILAVCVQRTDPRTWVRKIAWAAFALVVVQGVFGGLGVLFMLSPPWPLLHSVFSQVFLCTLVVLAAVLSPRWRTDGERPIDDGALALLRGAAFSIIAVFVQLLLGAAARHGYLAREVHSMFALVVVVLLAKLVLTGAGDTDRALTRIRRPAILLGVLVAVQVALGVTSYIIATQRAVREAAGLQDLLPLADIATLNLHLVVGASVLALCVTLFVRGVRIFGAPTDERIAEARLEFDGAERHSENRASEAAS